MSLRPLPTALHDAETRALSFSRAIVAMGRTQQLSEGVALARNMWPGDQHCRDMITRAAVVPASTTSVTQLNMTSISSLVDILGPSSACGTLFRRAIPVSLDSVYGVTVPTITASGSNVTFVGEGSPLAVKQFSFDARCECGNECPQHEVFGEQCADQCIGIAQAFLG
jgi:hypothetical protein